MSDQKKKSLFDKAIDVLTNRDEKAAAEKAAVKKPQLTRPLLKGLQPRKPQLRKQL